MFDLRARWLNLFYSKQGGPDDVIFDEETGLHHPKKTIWSYAETVHRSLVYWRKQRNKILAEIADKATPEILPTSYSRSRPIKDTEQEATQLSPTIAHATKISRIH